MDNLRSVLDGVSDSEEACKRLRTFLIAYGVSRTFRGLSADNMRCLKPLVEHLRKKKNPKTAADVVAQVEGLADACLAAGFGRNMSFASKCLCMLGGHVPIYSSEAVAYLGTKKAGPVDYGSFHTTWLAEYEARRVSYEGAAAKLLGEEETRRGLDAKWVGMRGLDVRMMAIGGPMR